MKRPDISAILTVHQEGLLASLSMKSLLEAAECANSDGLNVEVIVVLDRADKDTTNLFELLHHVKFRIEYTDFGDQGKVRNFAVQKGTGDYIAFLDGDDLWSYNWLSLAWKATQEHTRMTIFHPEFNWMFENSNGLLLKCDTSDNMFDTEYLRVANYWDALCFASKEVHENFPYSDRQIKAGFAYEDWHWNCVTLLAGYEHKVVPDTIHFKRRRSLSQTIEASSRRALARINEVFAYSYYADKDHR